jgi:hypothetical protein
MPHLREKAMSDLDLPALKKLCEAATPGPWAVHIGEGKDSRHWCGTGPLHFESATETYLNNSRCDAQFIAAARTALPELIEQMGKLEFCVRHWESMSETYRRENTALKARISELEALEDHS